MNEQNIQWTKIAETKSFEEEPEQLIKVKRDDILVIKSNDQFHAVNNRCPHLGMSLHAGGCNLEDGTVQCKFHSSTFSYETGEVKAWLNVKGFEKFMGWLFSKFDSDVKKMMAMEATPLETFRTKVDDGHVWVGIDQGE